MPAATRAVLRQSQFLTRRTAVRHASSSSEKASQTASQAASKAQQGLSKATAAAGPALNNAASACARSAAPSARSFRSSTLDPHSYHGGTLPLPGPCSLAGLVSYLDLNVRTTSRLTALLTYYASIAMIPPAIYYSRVGLELGKLVFRGQKMTPPNLATFQSYFQPLINAASNPATLKNISLPSPQNFLARVRNANAKEIAFVGVTAAEVIGFFTVGEIIGRFNLVGYRGEVLSPLSN
ncbi:ATP synthase subunit G atp20 [Penicillium chermesinum]|nr:ATP synthase subunit G atp20 [Penicillium chermesinum]